MRERQERILCLVCQEETCYFLLALHQDRSYFAIPWPSAGGRLTTTALIRALLFVCILLPWTFIDTSPYRR